MSKVFRVSYFGVRGSNFRLLQAIIGGQVTWGFLSKRFLIRIIKRALTVACHSRHFSQKSPLIA